MNAATRDLMVSSKDATWATPPELIGALRRQGFAIDLDVAASEENAVADFYYDEAADGLKQSWNVAPLWAWCNPPYGRALKVWTEKACFESTVGAKILYLVPGRIDTRWFRLAFTHAAECRVFNKRIKFVGADAGALFPSVLFLFYPHEGPCHFVFCDKEGVSL